MKKIGRVYSGTMDRERSEREIAHGKLARRLAIEGIVLLKNEGLLPLDISDPVALLGSGADKTIKGGTGSGDVNNRENVSIYRGLKDAGIFVTSRDWIQDYQKRYENARNAWREKVLAGVGETDNPFDSYAKNPFSLPEGRGIEEEDIKGAAAAIYVISRISGEGRDRRKEKGDYYLSQKEREDILYLDKRDIPIVLVLNVGAPVELAGILKEAASIRAVLNISLPGQEGGHAVADVLYGKAVPCGRLTTTWAVHYEDYPSAACYGYLDGNLEKEEYREGIYVGYRYFDSFGIKPLFPFGYGLSYASFLVKFEDIRTIEAGIEVSVLVENIGESYSGREVVQIYITPPQTGIAKEYQRLVGFAKTDILAPGAAQRLSIVIEQKQLAIFSEEVNAWLVEAGKYGVWIGNNVDFLNLAALIDVRETGLLELTSRVCKKAAAFQDFVMAGYAREKNREWLAQAEEQQVPIIIFKPQKEKKKVCKVPYAKERKVEELIPFLHGKITQESSMLGAAGILVPGSAGETMGIPEEAGKERLLVMADGPAGLRLQKSYEVDRETGSVCCAGVFGSLENGFLREREKHQDVDTYYQYCTAFPVGTALAQTWDPGLLEEFGRAVAEEMEEFNIGLWLAPGMNIHRNPLCGRNFEYYSEDPLLSGIMAAAVTNGVQSNGKCGVTIKHFACNNQEDNRMGVDACVSQRALREIYFRGFEIVVKKSAPVAIMTSYNRINGVHAANSKDICSIVARGEWGFEGVFLSDWSTTVPVDGSVPWKCIAAGNDIIMPGCPKDDMDIREAYAQGKLTEDDIRTCAGRVIALIKKFGIQNESEGGK